MVDFITLLCATGNCVSVIFVFTLGTIIKALTLSNTEIRNDRNYHGNMKTVGNLRFNSPQLSNFIEWSGYIFSFHLPLLIFVFLRLSYFCRRKFLLFQ